MYAGKEIERTLENIVHWVENKEIRVKTVIGGDFNVRKEREGGEV